MKIIFLDIDGCLHIKPSEGNSDHLGGKFKPEAVAALKKIIDATEAKIVISSNWKLQGIDYLRKVWKERNMPGEIIDITPVLNGEKRIKEIWKWFDLCDGIYEFIVVDDSTGEDLNEVGHRFINPNPQIGLTDELANKAIEVLK